MFFIIKQKISNKSDSSSIIDKTIMGEDEDGEDGYDETIKYRKFLRNP